MREKTNNLGSNKVRHKKKTVQSQKMVRGLKLWMYKVEELYYPCSENKVADQLGSNCESDQRLCFRLSRLLVFPCSGSFMVATFPVGKLKPLTVTTYTIIGILMPDSIVVNFFGNHNFPRWA